MDGAFEGDSFNTYNNISVVSLPSQKSRPQGGGLFKGEFFCFLDVNVAELMPEEIVNIVERFRELRIFLCFFRFVFSPCRELLKNLFIRRRSRFSDLGFRIFGFPLCSITKRDAFQILLQNFRPAMTAASSQRDILAGGLPDDSETCRVRSMQSGCNSAGQCQCRGFLDIRRPSWQGWCR